MKCFKQSIYWSVKGPMLRFIEFQSVFSKFAYDMFQLNDMLVDHAKFYMNSCACQAVLLCVSATAIY